MIRASSLLKGEVVKSEDVDYRPQHLALSPNNQFLIASTDKDARILDPQSLEYLKTLDTGCTFSSAFSHDTLKLAVVGEQRVVRLLSVPTFEVLKEGRDVHTAWIRSVAFSPSSEMLVTGSDDKTAVIWVAATLTPHKVLTGHQGWVLSVLFLSNSIVATASRDASVRIWDASSGALTHEIKEHKDSVNSLSLSPNGIKFATASSDSTVKIYDAATYFQLRSIACVGAVTVVNFCEEETVLVGVKANAVLAINVSTGEVCQKLGKLEDPSSLVIPKSSSLCF